MAAQTQEQVHRQLDRIERKLGRPKFSKMFRSITVDNGSEFLDAESMKKSLTSKAKPRTKLYYCHPYSAWERGTNEQMNGQIRRFIPKGSSIAKVNTNEVTEMTDWLNDYPKRSLNRKMAREVFMSNIAVIM